MTALLPCPFCGSESEPCEVVTAFNDRFFECRDCGASSPRVKGHSEYVELLYKWNHRPVESTLRASNARLRELLWDVVKQTKEIKGEESENQSVERMVEWHKLRSRIQSELKE